MKIVKTKLDFDGGLIPFVKTKVDGIALHHSDHPTWGIKEIHEFHKNSRGWSGIGYQYFIAKDGTIYEGRGANIGAHVKDENSHLVGICFQGNFDENDKTMSDAQFNSGVYLIQFLKSTYPNVKKVDGHKAWSPTACPGKYFPLEEMKIGKLRGQTVSKNKQDGLDAVGVLHKAGLISNLEEWRKKVLEVENLEYVFIKWASGVK